MIDYKASGYSAFPFSAENPIGGETIEVFNEKVRPGQIIGHEGMTLRDYFAAKAMPMVLQGEDHSLEWTWQDIAEMSYQMADAMLAAREVQS